MKMNLRISLSSRRRFLEQQAKKSISEKVKSSLLTVFLIARNELMNHHRNFLSAVRNVVAETQEAITATAVEETMSLDHINIGQDFVAVAGVFSDHAFLEYLYQQASIDYVEQNQVYKTTNYVPKEKRQEEARRINTVKSANWGLARINQHERGDLNQYDYDTMGG